MKLADHTVGDSRGVPRNGTGWNHRIGFESKRHVLHNRYRLSIVIKKNNGRRAGTRNAVDGALQTGISNPAGGSPDGDVKISHRTNSRVGCRIRGRIGYGIRGSISRRVGEGVRNGICRRVGGGIRYRISRRVSGSISWSSCID